MNKLKKMALKVIAESLSEEEIAGLKEIVGANLKESEIYDLMHAVGSIWVPWAQMNLLKEQGSVLYVSEVAVCDINHHSVGSWSILIVITLVLLSTCFEDILKKDPTCSNSLTKLVRMHQNDGQRENPEKVGSFAADGG
ncbi:hypothetical protein CMV_013258 [Castanea mollissima]|uniref:Uncharacterized protein n=1 Tax=Castanea mollissima TaxID=60419 RepID=A0A8J4VM57_9ROSI|nr:hypothetical protein CMV_013258 [Castanea mollissima]